MNSTVMNSTVMNLAVMNLDFARPWMLYLALPWLLFALYFAGRQFAALGALRERVDERFRGRFTVHDRASLTCHLLLIFVTGLALLAAAAGPTVPGDDEITAEGGDVLLLIDASASMKAQDVTSVLAGEELDARFELARQIARALVRELDDARFGVASFSGVASVALPVTDDHALVDETLRTLEVHTFYQNTGSSFTAALDTALQFAADPSTALQVVLLSDGEMPRPEDFSAPLHALEERGIAVHGVALGSTEGQGRVIYDFRDIVAKKEKKGVLKEFFTRRVDEHLKRIAHDTAGTFEVADEGTIDRLAEAIRSRPRQAVRLARDASRRDVGRIALLLFGLGFLIDLLWIGRRRRPGGPIFAVEHLGLVALLCVLWGCESLLEQAHRENEQGIAKDAQALHPSAYPHYERSRAFGVRPQIPTYNLARSHTLAKDHGAAHRLYQEAIELDPELAVAFYNDGVTLFRWGEAERDPQGCQLDRTLDLWENARGRFETARDLKPGTPLAQDAQVNLLYVRQKLEEFRALAENPPPDCSGTPPPPPPPPPEPPPPDGAPPPPDGGAGDDTGGGLSGGMSDEEEQEIGQALARIEEQRQGEEKFHRRSLPEQFPKEAWENPESEIWW